MKNNRIVAIVRRREHLEQLHEKLDSPTEEVHFVCLSFEIYLACLKKGYSVSLASDYPEIAKRHFTAEGHQLARDWAAAAVGTDTQLSDDMIIFLSTKLTYFFSIALFARFLIKAVVNTEQPELVYLCFDIENPILSDFTMASGEESIFAHISAAVLSEHNIQYDFLKTPDKNTGSEKEVRNNNSLWLQIRQYRDKIPGSILTLWRSIRKNWDKVYNHLTPNRLRLCYHITKAKLHRFVFRDPIVLFWGGHVDGVYQAELSLQWAKIRGWGTLRFESSYPGSMAIRSKTRNSTVPFGLDQAQVLHYYGKDNLNDNPSINDIVFERVKTWTATTDPELKSILRNPALEYQFLAMTNMAISLQHKIHQMSSVVCKINPDLVVTHLDSLMAMAARKVHVPSLVLAHGGIISPYFSSLHGDVNVVPGEIQRKAYQDLDQHTGKIVAAGSPHIRIDQNYGKKTASLKLSHNRPLTITFLPMSSHYLWSPINFRIYHQICESLSGKITTENLNLVVKLHPRYSLMGKNLYKQLFTGENRPIRFEDSPDFKKTLQHTDILVCTGITTGILEAVAAGVPVIIMLMHYPSFQISQNQYYWIFKNKLIVPNSLEDFENELSKLKMSPEYQKEVIRKQTDLLPFLLKSWGSKASEVVADIGLDCMNRDKVL